MYSLYTQYRCYFIVKIDATFDETFGTTFRRVFLENFINGPYWNVYHKTSEVLDCKIRNNITRDWTIQSNAQGGVLDKFILWILYERLEYACSSLLLSENIRHIIHNQTVWILYGLVAYVFSNLLQSENIRHIIHNQPVHNGFRLFDCEYCSVGYQTEEDLKTHI